VYTTTAAAACDCMHAIGVFCSTKVVCGNPPLYCPSKTLSELLVVNCCSQKDGSSASSAARCYSTLASQQQLHSIDYCNSTCIRVLLLLLLLGCQSHTGVLSQNSRQSVSSFVVVVVVCCCPRTLLLTIQLQCATYSVHDSTVQGAMPSCQ
jgi:hypothetical protein